MFFISSIFLRYIYFSNDLNFFWKCTRVLSSYCVHNVKMLFLGKTISAIIHRKNRFLRKYFESTSPVCNGCLVLYVYLMAFVWCLKVKFGLNVIWHGFEWRLGFDMEVWSLWRCFGKWSIILRNVYKRSRKTNRNPAMVCCISNLQSLFSYVVK